MSKKIYFFEPTNKNAFSYFDIIEDDAQVPANATTVAPFDGEGKPLLNPTWNGLAWTGVDEETWRKSLPEVPHEEAKKEPSSDDQDIIVLTAQLLQTQMTVKQQGTQIASLTGALLANAKAKATN
ncbi:hypothetical protein H0G69_10595 (plasmid) [Limosilactobacillus mucosae]|uniref:hypothetical protein n=1 Tax=Limosilactobacillus mucosae TaxID=97478 RepID=UPI0015D52A70|nr:hypothetical protein [Limosilactobacillus mucosae]QLI94478.1 hypothetical protein H0G69_05760 [Limosilactobacillus mucosae]QLI95445.1 hypothetical protein H0G69_10595 [Limosilactobacillus mucosae]